MPAAVLLCRDFSSWPEQHETTKPEELLRFGKLRNAVRKKKPWNDFKLFLLRLGQAFHKYNMKLQHSMSKSVRAEMM
jgi:hypothetical protein